LLPTTGISSDAEHAKAETHPPRAARLAAPACLACWGRASATAGIVCSRTALEHRAVTRSLSGTRHVRGIIGTRSLEVLQLSFRASHDKGPRHQERALRQSRPVEHILVKVPVAVDMLGASEVKAQKNTALTAAGRDGAPQIGFDIHLVFFQHDTHARIWSNQHGAAHAVESYICPQGHSDARK
jgi:hypothetical protein